MSVSDLDHRSDIDPGAIAPGAIEHAPATARQARCWALFCRDPSDLSNNLAARVGFPVPVDAGILARAVRLLIERHALLRTRFEQRDDGLVQRADLAPDHIAITRAGGEAQIAAIAAAPYDLAHGPLFRPILVGAGDLVDGMVLAFHHAVVDWVSLDLLLGELLDDHALLRDGSPVTAVPESAYLRHAERIAGQPPPDELVDYWRGRLPGLQGRLDLPPVTTQDARTAPRTAGRVVPVVFPTALAQAIEAGARRHGTSRFGVLLAGWACVLARLTSAEDIAIGTSVANRGAPATRGLIGPLADLTVLRCRVPLERGFAAMLVELEAHRTRDLAHGSLAMSDLLALHRSINGEGAGPLCSAAMNALHRNATRTLDGRPIDLEVLSLGGARDDVMLEVVLGAGSIEARLEWRACLLDQAVAEALATALPALLEAGLADPACPIACLPLGDGPRARLEADAIAPGGPPSIAARFEAIAAQRSDAIALIHGEERATYRALHRRAGGFAAALRRDPGAAPGVVAILLDRSIDLVAALLAAARLGATFVLLDPHEAEDRLRYMLADSRATRLVCRRRPAWLDDTLPIELIETATVPADASAPPIAEPDPDRPSHLVYTSGSTGRPKAVMARQTGLLARLDWMAQAFPWRADDVGCQKTTVGFVDVYAELLGPVLAGVPLVIAPADAAAEPRALAALIERHRVTRLVAVPSLLRALLADVRDAAERLRSLRLCVSSGEPLPVDLAMQLTRALPAAGLLNLYGSAEVSADVTWHLIDPTGEDPRPAGTAVGVPTPRDRASPIDPQVDGRSEAAISIGVPLAGHVVTVADPAGRPVPIGFPGELRVSGPGLAHGYLGADSARFVDGGSVFRTGDLGRLDADRRLRCLGRLDAQIKLRGVRIEPMEIRRAILAIAAELGAPVEDAAVVLHGADGREPALVAWLMTGEGRGPIELAAIRRALRARLSTSMCPTRLVCVESLPLTPSGKIDRRALGQRPLPEAPVEPDARSMTEAEARVAAVWSAVLERDVRSPDAEFFTLGGDSFAAIRMAARLGAALGRPVQMNLVFDQPILEGFVAALDRRSGSADAAGALPPLAAIDPAVPVPASIRQAMIWARQQINPGELMFNECAVFSLRGPLDRPRLAAAIDRLVARHEALRTRLVARGGRPHLVVDPPPSGVLTVVELRDPAQAGAVARAAARTPFALDVDLPIRAVLAVASPDEASLVMVIHHTAIDGWSSRRLMRELSVLYQHGAAASLPAPRFSVRDVAAWEAAVRDSDEARRHRAWWHQTLAGATAFSPAWRSPERSDADPALITIDVALGADAVRRVDSLARTHGATRTAVLLAAWGLLLGRYHRSRDLIIATPVANRGRAELDGVVGMLADLAPIRIQLDPDRSFGDLVTRVQDALIGAVQHELAHWSEVAAPGSGWHPGEAGSGVRLSFVYRDSASWALDLPGLEVESTLVLPPVPKLTLGLVVDGVGEDLASHLEVDARVVPMAVAHALARAFGPLVLALDLDARVSSLPVPQAVDDRTLAPRSSSGAVAVGDPVGDPVPDPVGDLLDRLAALNVQLTEDHGALKIRGKASVVTRELGAELQAHKAALLARLRSGSAAVPLAENQRRLWFISQLQQSSAAFVMAAAWALDDRLDVPALARAVDALCERHAILAVRIEERVDAAGKPDPHLRFGAGPAPRLQITAAPVAVTAAMIEDHARLPFQLTVEPPFRIAVIRQPGGGWVLTLAMHHIIGDRWSMGILMRDLAALYAQQRGDLSPTLAPLALSYVDAARRAAAAHAAVDAAALAHWVEILSDAPRDLALPFDAARPEARTDQRAALTGVLPADLAARVEAAAARAEVTPFMWLLTIHAALLARWTGQDRVVIGCPSGMRRDDTHDLIGFFVETVVLPVDLAADPSFADALSAVRRTCLDAFSRRPVPLGQLVERLRPQRRLNHAPLFEAMFVVQTAEMAPLQLAGTAVAPMTETPMPPEVDLNLAVEPAGRGEPYGLYLEYDATLFHAETARAFLDHFVALVEVALAAPSARISKLPLARAAGAAMLAQFGQGAAPGPARFGHVAAAIAAMAAEQAEAPALIAADGTTLSRGELDRRVAALAARLAASGATAGEVIGLHLARSADAVIAMLAVLRTGAAYAVVPPGQPVARRSALIAQAQIRRIIGLPAPGEPAFEALPWFAVADEPPGPAPAPAPAIPDGSGLAAYVCFTSGSTGAPKGVIVPHDGLMNHARAIVRDYGLRSTDRVLHLAELGFDVAGEEIFPTLIAGATVVIAGAQVSESLDALDALIEQRAISVVNLPASLWHAWVHHLDDSGRRVPPSVRLVIAGSDRVLAACLAIFRRIAPGVGFRNGYGPTEATITATLFDPARDPVGEGAAVVPIGRPIDGMTVAVVDGDGCPVPARVVGEIVISGPGVALGRLAGVGDSDFAALPAIGGGARCYRTGDLGRVRPDGVLEFLGRRDHQIKLRGYRIEPAEIEGVLATLDGISEACVLALGRGDGPRRLVAFLAGAFDAATVMAQLRARLPDYMVPVELVRLASLPRTTAGKLDRRALAACRPEVAEAIAAAPPQGALERLVAAAFAEVLDLRSVDRDGNFFELGGDSITSLRLVDRLARRGLRATVRDVFAHQTVAALAAAVSVGQPARSTESGVGPTSTTPIQAWFHRHVQVDPHHYNQAFWLRVPADATEAELRTTLEAVVDHHECLRLTISGSGETATQSIPAERVAPLFEVLDDATPEQVELAAARMQERLVPAEGRLVAALWPRGSDRMHLIIHHLAVDPVSWAVVTDDLSLAWQAIRAGTAPVLGRSTPYRVWARQLADYASSAEVRAVVPRLVSDLAGPCARLSPHLPTQPGDTGTAVFATGSLDAQRTRALIRHVSSRLGARMDAALVAAVMAVARAHGADLPLRIDLESHGRAALFDDIDVSRTVGWFTAIVPLRVPPSDAALDQQVIAISRMIDAQPCHGLAHDVASSPHAPAAVRAALAAVPRSDILVNYLGVMDLDAGGSFAPVAAPSGFVVSPRVPRSELVEINAGILEDALTIEIVLPAGDGMEALAQTLVAQTVGALEQLERCLRRAPDGTPLPPGVASAHRLGPLQEGILFHSLREPETYFDRLTMHFEGPLDPAVLRRCWELLSERHDALRGAVAWTGRTTPLFTIHERVALDWSEDDWTELSPEQQRAMLAAAARAEVARGFDLTTPPLQRFRLIRLAAGRHALLWCSHHLILDGWSSSILLGELFALYEAQVSGLAQALPPAASFADHLDRLAARSTDEASAFWARQLAGFSQPAVLAVPGLAPARPPAEPQRVLEDHWTSSESAALTALAKSHRVTTSTVIQAAWAVLLSRYTGRGDVLFGLTVSGRELTTSASADVVGMLINTLPVRVGLGADQTVGELLGALAAGHAERMQRGGLSLARARELTALPGDAELFDSLLLIQNYPMAPDHAGGGVRLSGIEVGERTNYPVTLIVTERQGLVFTLSLDGRKLSEPAGRAVLGHLRALLSAMAATPDARLAELPIESTTMAQDRLASARGPRLPVPPGPVHAIIGDWAAKLPHAPAVLAPDGKLTYAELWAAAEVLAERLVDSGVEPGACVGLAMSRTSLLPTAFLAILRAGAVVVPLDPSYPADRLGHMIRTSGTRLVISDGDATADWLGAAVALSVTSLPRPDGLARRAGKLAVAAPTGGYVIFTSGSTGVPKGVKNSDAGMSHLAVAQRALFQLAPGDRVLQFASLSFDASIWELVMALGAGATLCIPEASVLLGAADLASWLARERITAATLPPSLLAVLPDRPLPDLRVLVSAGEACPPALARRWAEGRRWFNAYGPSEATVCATAGEGGGDGRTVPIGRPISNVDVHVLDPARRPVPTGTVGELWIGGLGVADGYLGQPELTAERFIADPFDDRPGARLYRTGDLGYLGFDGELRFVGRTDRQLKVRGFRIEPGEVEAILAQQPGVARALAGVRRDAGGHARLVAWVVPAPGVTLEAEALRKAAATRLPAHLVPSVIGVVERIPTTPNGKIDWAALPEPSPAPAVPDPGHAPAAVPAPVPAIPVPGPDPGARTREIAERITRIWLAALGRPSVGLDDSFFEAGGHSLLLIDVHRRLENEFGLGLAVVDLFRLRTIRLVTHHIAALLPALSPALSPAVVPDGAPVAPAAPARPVAVSRDGHGVAIIGMAGRFPGAPDLDAYWSMLHDSREGIARFDDAARRAAGVSDELARIPGYVPAAGVIEDADRFDASFFGFSPRDAELLDPQHRLVLECAWHALENAGIDPETAGYPIGLYAGAGYNTWLPEVLVASGESLHGSNGFHVMTSNEKDFLAARVAHRLNLSGPAVVVQTACSTSLVAVDLACQALATSRCRVALAGGVALSFPQERGYLHEPGMILSPDGHCRAFSADAAGTVPGSGVGLVVLKRLADAVADGDRILAVIRGTAINNDGARKVGFTAPSIDGQAAVIRDALAAARLDRGDIDYVEAHGTGTVLGDPVEVAALAAAYGGRSSTLFLGSVKTNIGHADTAAGIAGLIKVVLAMQHGELPASLHCRSINPKIELAAGPFEVVSRTRPWPVTGRPRRAGVSSFGIGGTNAHVIVEQAPPRDAEPRRSDSPQAAVVLPLSGHDAAALARQETALAAWLDANPHARLTDVACTLQRRRAFRHRRAVVASTLEEARLRLAGKGEVLRAEAPDPAVPAALLFPGQGSQHPEMARALVQRDPQFAADLRTCETVLGGRLGAPLLELLADPDGAERLRRTEIAQPVIFAVSWALARRWQAFGLEVEGLLGHSVGEYVAACLAGVFDLENALHLVAERGRLVAALPGGSMLAVPLSEHEVRVLLGDTLRIAGAEVAAINGPEQTVVSGTDEAIGKLEQALRDRGVAARRTATSHAFHSAMMEPAMEPLAQAVRAARPRPPVRRFLSNLTGSWIDPSAAVDPGYWARHLRHAVRFADGLSTLHAAGIALLIEAGPGQTLTGLARRMPWRATVVPSLAHAVERPGGGDKLGEALCRVWLAGHALRWDVARSSLGDAAAGHELLSLPSYPFARDRHWPAGWRPRSPVSDAPAAALGPAVTPDALAKRADAGTWFYRPSWLAQGELPAERAGAMTGPWLILSDAGGIGDAVAEILQRDGHAVSVIRTTDVDSLSRALDALAALDAPPGRIVHLWTLDDLDDVGLIEHGLRSLLAVSAWLARARPAAGARLDLITRGGADLPGARARAGAASVMAASEILPYEDRRISVHALSVETPQADAVADWLGWSAAPRKAALVGQRLFVPGVDHLAMPEATTLWKPGGTHLITGGFGGVGSIVAEALAEQGALRLILIGRPTRDPARLAARRSLIARLQHHGADVLSVELDLGDRDAVLDAVAGIVDAVGTIDAVFHVAGLSDDGGVIQKRSWSATTAVMAAKVVGTRALFDGLEANGCTVDAMVLFSTLGSLLPAAKFGQVGYAAANGYLDLAPAAFRGRRAARRLITVNWDDWAERGMTVAAARRLGIPVPTSADAMTPAEGMAALARVLSSAEPRVVVSIRDLPALIASADQIFDASRPGWLAPAPAVAAAAVPRAPSTGDPLIDKLTALMAQVLGSREVVDESNFFDHGGHSLSAMRVVSGIRESEGIELGLADLFENPTPRRLAEMIRASARQ